MRIERRFTRPGQSPYEGFNSSSVHLKLRNPDGSTVFKLDNIDVPEQWTQLAIDILAQKYFPEGRDSAGGADRHSARETRTAKPVLGVSVMPARCLNGWPAVGPIGAARIRTSTRKMTPKPSTTKCATCWPARWPRRTRRSGSIRACTYAYGLSGPAQGHYYVDPVSRESGQGDECLRAPATSCLLHPIHRGRSRQREWHHGSVGRARRGSLSMARGREQISPNSGAMAEPLSGGGRSSGLMSFLRIGDRAAGAIKSGGTTRRAAKMVCLDLDHPDIEEFIDWKVVEEQKVSAMVTGSKVCAQRLNAVLKACHVVDAARWAKSEYRCFRSNPELRKAIREARQSSRARTVYSTYVLLRQQGFTHFAFHEYDTNWDGKAYQTVSGQNSNNSVRVPNEIFRGA